MSQERGGTAAGADPPTAAGTGRGSLLEDLGYELPPELIAQQPIEPRDASRLLVFHRLTGAVEDRAFRELPALLHGGDVLVRNDTRVFPARSFFRRVSGGRLEVLFLRPTGEPDLPESWEVLLRGRPRSGEVLACEHEAAEWSLRCEQALGDGRWVVTNLSPTPVLELLETAGVTPLPPYIRSPLQDVERYQTSYARAVGSAAAPTAGLHFTPRLDVELAAAGVQIETLTLHVGLGTFMPLRAEAFAGDRLHSESYEVDGPVWERLLSARAEGRRVIAVGTTSMRVLEHLAGAQSAQRPPAAVGGQGADSGVLRGDTSLFIRPGFEARLVGGLITNFHLPRTSLLALVMAFCGVAETQRLYQHAVRERYRFYSFGDGMLAV